jgi:hypothetical protein
MEFAMYKLLLAGLVLSVYGCAQVQPINAVPYVPPKVTAEKRVEKSYRVGEEIQAYVGERMVRVQDFNVLITETSPNSTRLMPSESFTIRVPPFYTAAMSSTEIAEVLGTVNKGGGEFRVVRLPSVPPLMFLLTDSGSFEGSALNNAGAQMGWTYTPEPAHVRLLPEKGGIKTDLTKGFLNFELVYGGSTRDAFQVLYREYTKEDLVKPAFTQTLVYEKGAGLIRFRGIGLKVAESTNEKIRFSVVTDDYGK